MAESPGRTPENVPSRPTGCLPGSPPRPCPAPPPLPPHWCTRPLPRTTCTLSLKYNSSAWMFYVTTAAGLYPQPVPTFSPPAVCLTRAGNEERGERGRMGTSFPLQGLESLKERQGAQGHKRLSAHPLGQASGWALPSSASSSMALEAGKQTRLKRRLRGQRTWT